MEKYRIEFKKSAIKELHCLPKRDINAIDERIQSLAENPRPVDCKKLSTNEEYRIRPGNYRVIYTIYDNILVIHVIKVTHRKDVYR